MNFKLNSLKNLIGFSVFTLVTASSFAQIQSIGTNGQPPANDASQLPPEVRQLIPQNQGGTQALPTQAVQPAAPASRPPSQPYSNAPTEAFPASQSPNLRPNQSVEAYTPSEVVSSVHPLLKPADVRAVLRTSVGDITIKLDRVRAPATVAHFVALARGEKEFIDVKTSKRAKRPFYNGLTFHRVTRGYLIQTGCPFGTGRGTAGDIATVRDEIKPGMKFSRPGMVAMAPLRDGSGLKNLKDTNSSQFFITLNPMPQWDDQFTIFGEVEDGMDVVEKISGVKVGPTERPIKRIYLVAVDIIEGSSAP